VSTKDKRGADMDRLLRAVLKPASQAEAPARVETTLGGCPDAGLLAAYVDGGVSAQERTELEAHIVQCGRCQETLAVLGRELAEPEEEAATIGVRWFTWVTRPRLRWLIPVTAVATIAVLFVATRPLIAPGDSSTPGTAAQFAQAHPPQEALASQPPASAEAKDESAKRDASATSPAKPSGDSALKKEPAKREANQASSAKQVADAASVPSPVGQAVVDKKAAAEAAAGFADRVATDEKRARAVAEPAAAPVAVAQEELRNELRSFEAAPHTVEAPGGSVRWRFASGGQIWRSADAGSTWHSQPSGVSADLFAGAAPSPATCWAVGAAGTVLLTRDGERWERRPFPLPVDLVSVEARNARNAIVTARDGRQFATLDGGATWIPR